MRTRHDGGRKRVEYLIRVRALLTKLPLSVSCEAAALSFVYRHHR